MQYTVGSFYGQMSEDDKLVREAQVLYSENLDLTSSTDFVTISPQPTSLCTMSYPPQVLYFLERDINKLIIGNDEKQIFVDTELKYTWSYDVKVFWSNSKYLYWQDANEKVYRILLTHVQAGNWTWNVEAKETNLVDSLWKGFVVEGEGSAFLGYGTKLYEINNDTGLLMNEFPFLYEKLVGMIDSRDVIELIQKNWVIFSWDRVLDTAPSYNLGLKVAVALQSADERYMIGEGGAWIMSWGALNKVAWQHNSDVLGQSKFSFRELENSNLWFNKQVVFLWTDDIDAIEDTWFVTFGNTSVVMFGNKKSWFPPWLSKYINTSSDWSKYDLIYGMICKSVNINGLSDTLYIAYKNKNGVYWVDQVNLSTQNYMTSKEGIMILPLFDWGNKNVEKRLNKVKIRADFGSNAGKFYIYKVIDWELIPFGWDRELSCIEHTQGFWTKELVISENFFDIAIAIVFKQDSQKTRKEALKFYSFTYDYEPIRR